MMLSDRSLAKYLATRALLDAGYDQVAVGRAMGALEPGPEPTPEDEADYRAWCEEVDARNLDLEDLHREAQWLDSLERARYEHFYSSNTLRPAGGAP